MNIKYCSSFLLILMLLFFDTSHARDFIIKSGWYAGYEEDGVKLEYRWLNIADTLETRQLRATFEVKACHEKILRNFRSSRKLSEWSLGARKCHVKELSQQEWISYTLFDIPKPFPQRDIVTLHKLVEDKSKTRVVVEAKPTFMPREEGIRRMEKYAGEWILYHQKAGKTLVEFYSITFEEPMLPRFLLDPIVQRMMVSSLNELAELSED